MYNYIVLCTDSHEQPFLLSLSLFFDTAMTTLTPQPTLSADKRSIVMVRVVTLPLTPSLSHPVVPPPIDRPEFLPDGPLQLRKCKSHKSAESPDLEQGTRSSPVQGDSKQLTAFAQPLS